MRRVLKRVREDQGADAVILSNRRVDEGIEVIAAVDYDEALMQHALRQEPADPVTLATKNSTPLPAVPEVTGAVAETDEVEPPADADPVVNNSETAVSTGEQAETAVEVAHDVREAARAAAALRLADVLAQREPKPAGEHPPTASESFADLASRPVADDRTLATMRTDISSLRGLLETQVSGLLWADGNRRSPVLSQVLRNLARMGVAPDIAQRIVDRLGPVDDLKHIWQQPLAALANLLPVTASTLVSDGGVAALVGPTGSGKTTTIAKLATSYAMQHGTDDIALVCADAYRIGAREQLTAFASILGVGVHVASDADDLRHILADLQDKKLVLIDTEGMGQRDGDLQQRLTAWQARADTLRFFLTLSACSQEAALDETIRAYRKLPLAGAIATKIDEAGQLGCVMSALIRQDLPLAWISDGQNIPDDLHAADRHKVWLLKCAVDCINASEPRIDEHTMAENYGKVSALHA